MTNPGRNVPLDLFLRYFFLREKKQHDPVDSVDREAVVDYVYYLQLYKGYLNAICKKPMTWQSRLQAMLSPDFLTQQQNQSLPVNVRLSFPEDVFELIVKAHGPVAAEGICRNQNERGLLTVRTNTIKTTREHLMGVFRKEGWNCQATQFAPNGIKFVDKPQGNFFALREFKEGHFEVQDEAS